MFRRAPSKRSGGEDEEEEEEDSRRKQQQKKGPTISFTRTQFVLGYQLI